MAHPAMDNWDRRLRCNASEGRVNQQKADLADELFGTHMISNPDSNRIWLHVE
jgi:hypothetical protein